MDDSSPLHPRHLHELERGSGIPGPLGLQSGLFTATAPAELTALGFSAAQAALVPALVFPMPGPTAEPVLYQIKPDAPRHIDGKLVKYETPAGARMRAYIHPCIRPQLKDPAIPLFITEGIKKTLCGIARDLCIVGLLGVYNFSGANEFGGVTELEDWGDVAWKSKDGTRRVVYIVYDSDIIDKEPVRQAAIKLAAMIRRRGAEPRAIRLPSKNDEKVGLDDYFVGGGSCEGLLELVDDSLLRADLIRTDDRSLGDVAAEAMAALVRYNSPPKVFVRAGQLVEVVVDEREIPRIAPAGTIRLRGILGRASGWYHKSARGKVIETTCPTEFAEDMRTLGVWPGVPPISHVARCPILAGGRIETARGYCPHSRIWLDSEPIAAFKGSGADAVDLLRTEIFGSFPFASPADFAHVIALAILPIVRGVIQGPTPLHLFGAPSPGTGKSLLAEACLMLTQGDHIAMSTLSKVEEETRKKITARMMAGSAYFFFDNLKGRIESEALEALLTGNEWEDRPLGGSTLFQAPITQAIVATGNNPSLGKDIVRRSVRIWIDAKVEHPEERAGFRNLRGYIAANRPVLQGALVRIVETWLAAGAPEFEERTWGSFEAWARVMGGILMSVGVEGFLGNVSQLREQAGDLESSWAAFYERWFRDFASSAVRARDLYNIFTDDDNLNALLGDRGDEGRKINLGKLIRSRVGMIVGGRVIETSAKDHNAVTYCLVDNEVNRQVKRLLDVERV